MGKVVTITIDKEALKEIDAAAKRENRSRSNFLQVAAVKRAREVEKHGF